MRWDDAIRNLLEMIEEIDEHEFRDIHNRCAYYCGREMIPEDEALEDDEDGPLPPPLVDDGGLRVELWERRGGVTRKVADCVPVEEEDDR